MVTNTQTLPEMQTEMAELINNLKNPSYFKRAMTKDKILTKIRFLNHKIQLKLKNQYVYPPN